MKVDDNLTIESAREVGMRADEYTIVSHDKDGEEVQYFRFYITDKGMIWNISKPEDVPS